MSYEDGLTFAFLFHKQTNQRGERWSLAASLFARTLSVYTSGMKTPLLYKAIHSLFTTLFSFFTTDRLAKYSDRRLEIALEKRLNFSSRSFPIFSAPFFIGVVTRNSGGLKKSSALSRLAGSLRSKLSVIMKDHPARKMRAWKRMEKTGWGDPWEATKVRTHTLSMADDA